MSTITDLQELLRSSLPANWLPAEITYGFEPQVSLKHKTGRKIRSSGKAESFQPSKGDVIVVSFERLSAASLPVPPLRQAQSVVAQGMAEEWPNAPARLARALDQALTNPRHNFVALKWFRDIELTRVGFSPEQARSELTRAIRQGWVRVEKLANPNSAFPTSTLQLDRNHEDVRRALAAPVPPRSQGGGSTPAAAGFTPVKLPPGVSASRMVIEDRR